jgi:hypothetical protein
MSVAIRTRRPVHRPYACESRSNWALKKFAKRASDRLDPAEPCACACLGLSISAAIAGDSVTDTIREKIVAVAIVSANWR